METGIECYLKSKNTLWISNEDYLLKRRVFATECEVYKEKLPATVLRPNLAGEI